MDNKNETSVERQSVLPDGFFDVIGRVSGEGVVKVPDEKVSVIFRQRHEGSSHHNEFNLVHIVSELLQLQQLEVEQLD